MEYAELNLVKQHTDEKAAEKGESTPRTMEEKIELMEIGDVAQNLVGLVYFGKLFDLSSIRDAKKTETFSEHDIKDRDIISEFAALVTTPSPGDSPHAHSLQNSLEHIKNFAESSEMPVIGHNFKYSDVKHSLYKLLAMDFQTAEEQLKKDSPDGILVPHGPMEDIISLFFYGNLFNNKGPSSSMEERVYERGSCFTYMIKDDSPTGTKEFDLIVKATALCTKKMTTRMSHKDALDVCFDHARRWLTDSDDSIPYSRSTYAEVKEHLSNITNSDYSMHCREQITKVAICGGT